METLSRREFLRVTTLAAAATVASACVQTGTPPASSPVDQPSGEPTAAQPAAPPTAGGYGESPMLATLVQEGSLPPVAERVPTNPYVIEGLDGVGQYGGNWRQIFRGMGDGGAVTYMVHRGLLDVNQDLVQVSHFAESWEVNDDATEFMFRLRPGAKWSDGAPITSEDMRFYYEDVASNRELTGTHPEKLANIVGTERIPAKFEAIDDFTVKYTFSMPAALFNMTLDVMDGILAVPAHYMKQFHATYADPAQLEAEIAAANAADWTELYDIKNDWRVTNIERPVHIPWVPKVPWTEDLVVFERNPYNWEVDTAGNQLPYIDTMTFRLFSDTQVAMMWAFSGEIDCQARHYADVPGAYTLLKQNEASGDYKVQLWESPRVLTAYFNMTDRDPNLRKLFQERDFRIAVSYAVDRDELREVLFNGLGYNTQYAPPPYSPLAYPKLADAYLEYDPDKANELLDGLGYTERDSEGYRLFPDGQRISFVCASREGPEATAEFLLLIDYLKAVGLNMIYRGMDRDFKNELHYSNEVDMSLNGAYYNLLPLVRPTVWVKQDNHHSRGWAIAWTNWWINPDNPVSEEPPEGHWIWDIWDLWAELQRTPGEDAQRELFWKILDIWAEELPCPGFVGGYPVPIVVKNGFKGIHGGYGWDGPTNYEWIINCSTWYWDEPEKHGM